jgi:hypothetical protein
MLSKKLFLLIVCLLYFALNFSTCASIVTSANTINTSSLDKNDEPLWVNDPYTKYDKQENVVAVGEASSREMAEKIAFGNLVAIFGQIIQVNEKVSSSYREAVKNGITAIWTEDTAVNTAITTSAGMNSLIGAEILARWDDGENFSLRFTVKLNRLEIITLNIAILYSLW